MEFDWDAAKADANFRKHGVSFDEAMQILDPQKPVVFEDKDHSEAEDRYYAIGVSSKGRLLTVCIAYRGAAVRIISARKSTKREVEIYADEIRKR
jgi:uncharacterized DUF497 family protein